MTDKMQFRLEPQYLYKLMAMPRGAMSSVSTSHRCNLPFKTLTIDFLGNIFLCTCDGWLPLPVGKVEDFDSIQQVFSSKIAQALQKDVGDQYFSWCAVEHCGILHRDQIRTKLEIAINIDESCNLACPSCRRSAIMVDSGPEFEKKIAQVNRIVSWLEALDEPVSIIMSGNGDPLASHIMRPLIKTYRPKPNQTFILRTNGLPIKKQIDTGLSIFDQISEFNISIDAGSKDVYEDVRRPGRWSTLIENFEYLAQLNKQHLVRLNFALQRKNYQDLPNFVSLCQHYGFQASIHQLDDWGTWSRDKKQTPDAWEIQNGTYLDHAVLDPSHAQHQDCLNILHSIKNQNLSFLNFSPMVKTLLKDAT